MAQETEAGEAEEEDDGSIEGGGEDLDPETLQRIRALGLGQKQRGKDTSRYRRGPKDEAAGPSEIGATGFATYTLGGTTQQHQQQRQQAEQYYQQQQAQRQHQHQHQHQQERWTRKKQNKMNTKKNEQERNFLLFLEQQAELQRQQQQQQDAPC